MSDHVSKCCGAKVQTWPEDPGLVKRVAGSVPNAVKFARQLRR